MHKSKIIQGHIIFFNSVSMVPGERGEDNRASLKEATCPQGAACCFLVAGEALLRNWQESKGDQATPFKETLRNKQKLPKCHGRK